ncbi:MAG: hypothetical protein ABI687_05250, partial [Flavitalea sp.]
MQENIQFGGWPNCIRLSNKESEIIVTTDIGSRVARFGFIGKQNFFYLSPDDSGKTGGEAWRIYGGHRLWLAPEQIPRSYYPDNSRVNYSYNGQTLTLTQEKEVTTGIIKQLEITLSAHKNEVTVLHRVINDGPGAIELSIWALSAMAAGGCAIIPQEPYGEGDDFLLPSRSLALWQYTKMNDPRWIWGDRYIQAKQDTAIVSEQKIGALNKQGWVAYRLGNEMLIKQFPFDAEAVYPDFGCNNEVYINGKFLEIETLGPLVTLLPAFAPLLLWPAASLVTVSNLCIMWCTSLPVFTFHGITGWDMSFFLLFMICMTFLRHRVLLPVAAVLIPVIAVSLHLYTATAADGRLHITMLSVGQAESMLVQLPDGSTM